MSETSNAIEQAVDQQLAVLSIGYTVLHMGQRFKAQEGDKPWDCDQWLVTFVRGTARMTTDYFTGSGHRKFPAKMWPPLNRKLRPYTLAWWAQEREKKPVTPKAASVLYSLVLDATAADMSFSNWCAEFGYSCDSISALNTYQACEMIAQEMNNLFGRDKVQALRELLQDY